MEPPHHSSPSADSTDIFSLSDQVLADKLQFIKEIGFGNWGSVWLCRPKLSPDSPSENDLVKTHEDDIAVKLVHRSKTATTAARVRSLWNEMKIVRTFKSDPHPAIIPFHSFVITPSYALITMTYLPTLIPVEVDESKARNWFRLLLSGVEFLHRRGVVHNDIKPANILLSTQNVPVLVDFGFAEKYDVKSSTAFHSNLSYGTPEYLSPERARGLPHDTRKSDVWSLGITFFEILVGRTPFEYSDGEQFTSKEDLETYWARTLRGKWVGTWKMSQDVERLLRRMTAPNADLRCTATDAMEDEYWHHRPFAVTHRRSSSSNSSVIFEKDLARLLTTPPKRGRKSPVTPPGLDAENDNVTHVDDLPRQSLTRSRSQPKVTAMNKIPPRKRQQFVPVVDLSPIKASPPATPVSHANEKENGNVKVLNSTHKSGRKPFGDRENIPQPQFKSVNTKPGGERRSRVFGDLTTRQRNDQNIKQGKKVKEAPSKPKMSNARDRVKEWERERERLREMERLEELEREREEAAEQVLKQETVVLQDIEKERQNSPPPASPTQLASPSVTALACTPIDTPRRASNSGLHHLKHSIKKSIDKTMQFYKSSTIGQSTGRNTPRTMSSFDILDDATRGEASNDLHSWEDDALIREAANSSLPVVRHAVHNERVGADSRADRMSIWMRNVEKVVEDARQSFALAATSQSTALPPLPVAPVASRSASATRTNRSSRLPRKVLAASQIFADENMQASDQSTTSNTTPAKMSTNNESPGSSSQLVPEVQTPSKKQRAPVSSCSQELGRLSASHPESPTKRTKNPANRLQLHIASLSQLEAELNKPPEPKPSPRLSQVLDSSLFIATPLSQRLSNEDNDEEAFLQARAASMDELLSSPHLVEPYPSRKPSMQNSAMPISPELRRLENVYDRFLMATSGVKRVGKGYQSNNSMPVSNIAQDSSSAKKSSHRPFQAGRRHQMPPPVSSDDIRPTVMVDEMGVMTCSQAGAGTPVVKDESNTTVALVRRAIKAMVPGKTASKRMSRVVA
ncbi:hypothetical protein AMATHDRAFT_199381 [Amanita thiersii Skay4041]|uniref:Protein kinase domain-containing protein n=1 Tax=Amanita thiersii Skay4041 TaxID=703135 RepID=A0A2A9NB32_9AGAR|nr:hypothetical protein AMATHDRAFT_199381 [Amanita thiersii Skay4041]